MPYKKPQVAKLVDISKERSDMKALRVREVVYSFLKDKLPITVNSIAEAAGVSRQLIYSNPELRNLIDYYGKFIQGCTPPDSEEEFIMLTTIPRLQYLEEEINKLLEENNELHVKLLEVDNELYALEHNL